MGRQDDLARRRRLARVAMWAFTVINAVTLVVLALAFIVPLPDRDDGWSVVVEYRDGRPAHVFLSPDEKWRLQVRIDEIDPKLVTALVALEDKRFWRHDGVDPVAVGRAALSNLTSGRRVSGGSTLTMQLARLLEPRARTVPNKLVDMFRAVQLDLRLSKQEILAEYLSRTPYGENVEGIESAAWSYFGHSAQHLTPLEVATLLAVPQGPARFAPSAANETRLRARRDAILGKLIEAGVFDDADATAALAEATVTPPPVHLLAMPREAPHAAIALRRRFPDRDHIRSTLDPGAQKLVERELEMRRDELHRKQVYSAAVVVVDHHTREVVALAGSLDFDDAKHGGQIAMFERPRSPGSTLKPFLYALAIDRGLALPGYLVADVPSQYGTYRPRNFDNDFAGLVTLKDSLSKSLNLPFIDLLARLGVEHFIAELERMNVSGARAIPGTYGLSMIVGGIELTPLEVAGMYATLAEDGRHRPLRMVDTDPQAADAVIYAPGAAFLTRQALAERDRPDFPRRRDVQGLPAEIHWKTGTSFGFRDAWAVGSGPRYTAVVWTGNVDNKPSADLVGSETPGPILFDVLEALTDRTRVAVIATPPADLTTIEVCAYSGHIATEACGARVKVSALLHSVPTQPCPYHHVYEVDRETRQAVLPACRLPGHDYDRKAFTVLPSSVSAWLRDRNRGIPEAPVFAERCVGEQGGAPVMVTPSENQVVMLIPGVPAKQQAVPLAVTTRADSVSWFVDGALVATVRATERAYWTPTPGKHDIVVSDETGRKARRVLDVR
ncbi:MAG: penicillin-binding protein 1C [Kofleriaceae bacterium]